MSVVRRGPLVPQRDYVCQSATYAWIDATDGGTNLGLGDDTSSAVTLPFPVPFYGSTTSTITVSSNGYARFDNGPAATEFFNESIPSNTGPNNFAAPFWDDLNPERGDVACGSAPSAPPHIACSWWVGSTYRTSPAGG